MRINLKEMDPTCLTSAQFVHFSSNAQVEDVSIGQRENGDDYTFSSKLDTSELHYLNMVAISPSVVTITNLFNNVTSDNNILIVREKYTYDAASITTGGNYALSPPTTTSGTQIRPNQKLTSVKSRILQIPEGRYTADLLATTLNKLLNYFPAAPTAAPGQTIPAVQISYYPLSVFKVDQASGRLCTDLKVLNQIGSLTAGKSFEFLYEIKNDDGSHWLSTAWDLLGFDSSDTLERLAINPNYTLSFYNYPTYYSIISQSWDLLQNKTMTLIPQWIPEIADQAMQPQFAPRNDWLQRFPVYSITVSSFDDDSVFMDSQNAYLNVTWYLQIPSGYGNIGILPGDYMQLFKPNQVEAYPLLQVINVYRTLITTPPGSFTIPKTNTTISNGTITKISFIVKTVNLNNVDAQKMLYVNSLYSFYANFYHMGDIDSDSVFYKKQNQLQNSIVLPIQMETPINFDGVTDVSQPLSPPSDTMPQVVYASKPMDLMGPECIYVAIEGISAAGLSISNSKTYQPSSAPSNAAWKGKQDVKKNDASRWLTIPVNANYGEIITHTFDNPHANAIQFYNFAPIDKLWTIRLYDDRHRLLYMTPNMNITLSFKKYDSVRA